MNTLEKKLPDFAVISDNSIGFYEFLEAYGKHEGYNYQENRYKIKYFGSVDGIYFNVNDLSSIRPNFNPPILTPQEAIALLTGKQLTEREKPCANCKETIAECACMRNICVKCNKPVGNITFSHCDKCFDILHSEPTQESVKERNGDPSMDDMIKLVEELTQQTAHLQQQLKEAKELLTLFADAKGVYQDNINKANQFLTRNK